MPSSTAPDRLVAIGPLHVISSSLRHRLLGATIAVIGGAILLLVGPANIFIVEVIWGAAGGIMLFNGLYLTGVRFQWPY